MTELQEFTDEAMQLMLTVHLAGIDSRAAHEKMDALMQRPDVDVCKIVTGAVNMAGNMIRQFYGLDEDRVILISRLDCVKRVRRTFADEPEILQSITWSNQWVNAAWSNDGDTAAAVVLAALHARGLDYLRSMTRQVLSDVAHALDHCDDEGKARAMVTTFDTLHSTTKDRT